MLRSPALPCNEHTMVALVLVYVLCVLHSGSQRTYALPSIGCLQGWCRAVRAASSTGSALRWLRAQPKLSCALSRPTSTSSEALRPLAAWQRRHLPADGGLHVTQCVASCSHAHAVHLMIPYHLRWRMRSIYSTQLPGRESLSVVGTCHDHVYVSMLQNLYQKLTVQVSPRKL